MSEIVEFSCLIGKVLSEVINRGDNLTFVVSESEIYYMHHNQDCCESVTIEDIYGELEWLVGEPILLAEERSNQEDTGEGSQTWTFYEIATIKGSVTIRWHGQSNGYYSERVDFERY